MQESKKVANFASLFGRKPCEAFSGILLISNMVDVAQLVRATDCGSVGRGFEPHLPPLKPDVIRLFVYLKARQNLFRRAFIFKTLLSHLILSSFMMQDLIHTFLNSGIVATKFQLSFRIVAKVSLNNFPRLFFYTVFICG